MTKYGKKILEIINSSKDHLTAEEIFMELRKQETRVVLATVYNNLAALCEEDRIRKVSVEGCADRYDRVRKHDHLMCKYCGQLADINFFDLTKELEEQLGDSILSYDLRVNYICPMCKAKQKNS